MQTFAEQCTEGEERQGKSLAEVAREAGIEHMVYSSVGGAERTIGVPHFKSKWHVEQHLQALGVTPTRLMARFNVGLATIMKTAQRMKRVGFLVRHSHPADRRASRVYLTERGRSFYESARQVWLALAERTVRGMTDIEKVLFRRLIQQALANLISDDDKP